MDDEQEIPALHSQSTGMRSFGALIVAMMFGTAVRAEGTASIPKPQRVAIPDGERGIGYDDLQYAPGLKRILVPAGRTGRLVLLDPATKAVVSIAGFSSAPSFAGGHGQGTTSAIELPGADGRIVATDRGSKTLKLVSAKTNSIVGSIKLAAAPDYVRAVPLTAEVWVTEPAQKQIGVLSVGDNAGGGLAHVSNIAVPDGPESLVIDVDRGRAYSHTWAGQSFAIDLKARKVVSTWRNGCRQSRGIALDTKRGWLFAGCAEGKATAVDLATGKILSTAETGSDVDSIGYSPTLRHQRRSVVITTNLAFGEWPKVFGGDEKLTTRSSTASPSPPPSSPPAARASAPGSASPSQPPPLRPNLGYTPCRGGSRSQRRGGSLSERLEQGTPRRSGTAGRSADRRQRPDRVER